MLQEYWRDGRPGGAPQGTLGAGVSVCFMCADALAIYHDVTSRGIQAERPFVGNGLWDVALQDPDGYHLHFESPTDVPEDTVLLNVDCAHEEGCLTAEDAESLAAAHARLRHADGDEGSSAMDVGRGAPSPIPQPTT